MMKWASAGPLGVSNGSGGFNCRIMGTSEWDFKSQIVGELVCTAADLQKAFNGHIFMGLIPHVTVLRIVPTVVNRKDPVDFGVTLPLHFDPEHDRQRVNLHLSELDRFRYGSGSRCCRRGGPQRPGFFLRLNDDDGTRKAQVGVNRLPTGNVNLIP